MDKKKITAIVIAGAVLLFIIAVVLFLIMSKKQDPVESLQKSIGYADGKLQFTIPETYNDSWYIQISGRMHKQSMPMCKFCQCAYFFWFINCSQFTTLT